MNILHILLLLNLAALAILVERLLRMRRQIASLQARSEALAGTAVVPADIQRMAREGASLLLIRILNPMELATQKHWAAGAVGRITPGLIRRIVANEAMKIVNQELPKYGVVAEVQVVGRD